MTTMPDRAEEFAFDYRNMDADTINAKVKTFEAWILTEMLVGADRKFTELEELTSDFTDVRITMQINGLAVNPKPLFKNIWVNLASIAQRAVVARLADTEQLDKVRELVDVMERRIKHELELIAEEKLGVSLDEIMSDDDNPFRTRY